MLRHAIGIVAIGLSSLVGGGNQAGAAEPSYVGRWYVGDASTCKGKRATPKGSWSTRRRNYPVSRASAESSERLPKAPALSFRCVAGLRERPRTIGSTWRCGTANCEEPSLLNASRSVHLSEMPLRWAALHAVDRGGDRPRNGASEDLPRDKWVPGCRRGRAAAVAPAIAAPTCALDVSGCDVRVSVHLNSAFAAILNSFHRLQNEAIE